MHRSIPFCFSLLTLSLSFTGVRSGSWQHPNRPWWYLPISETTLVTSTSTSVAYASSSDEAVASSVQTSLTASVIATSSLASTSAFLETTILSSSATASSSSPISVMPISTLASASAFVQAAVSSTSDSVSASTSATASISVPGSTTSGKPVFVHYMVGGMLEDHVRQDILDAQALGIDAFALNFDQFAYWSNDTVDFAFKHAEENDFKLLFSFDMSDGHFSNPSQYTDFLKSYLASSAYFRYNGTPLVTTFAGSSVSNADWQTFKDALGTPIILMPSFYDVTPTSTFFTDRPALDGTFNWNSWPWSGAGQIPVSTNDDQTYLSAAKASSKLFMMGMSPLQFKHMSTAWNWYARGEENLEVRMGQVLNLQPDMLELQTWNDAGESHYMGTIWPEWIVNPATNPITLYTQGLNHTGYWEVLSAFIQAWKRGDTTTDNMVPTNGKSAQGVFWHHPLLANADCSSDPLGQVGNHDLVQDLVTGIILVADGQSGLTATVTSGSTQLGTASLKSGFNKFSFDGLTTGAVSVKVTDGSGNTIMSGTGPVEVVNWSSVCNYNFQVVPLS